MRKFFLIIMSSIFLLAAEMNAQTNMFAYTTVDVFNANGQNPHDFIFSYDVVNGFHSCVNNFEIVSNVDYQTVFRYEIYLNGERVYIGSANVAPFGSVFFNDAFNYCNSLNATVRVNII